MADLVADDGDKLSTAFRNNNPHGTWVALGEGVPASKTGFSTAWDTCGRIKARVQIPEDVWDKTKDKEVVFPITEVVSKNEFFDYAAKYNNESDEITPARISDSLAERVSKLTSMIYDILDCYGIIRIDYIITAGEKINLLEINTTPGMTKTSFIPQQVRAAGLDIRDVMTDIIEDRTP